MELYIIREKKDISATCIFDKNTQSFIVKKGSRVSTEIHRSKTFRGANSIEKYRSRYVKDNVVLTDVSFKSSSTAANFVTGSSTNGKTAWKNKNGVALGKILEGGMNDE